MNKKVKSIIAAMVIAGTIPALTPVVSKAAENTCPNSNLVNQLTLSKDTLAKYSQAGNLKISTLEKSAENKNSNNINSSTSSPAKPVQNNGQSSDVNAEASEVIKLVNVERSKNGLAPLKANAELSKVAAVKSQDMADKNYFSHTSPTYGSPFDMMKKFGISYTAAGENIAYGQKTPEEVMNSWMNSPGHRANILNSNFTEIGVGIFRNKNGTPYWVQMFINPGK
ncbi:MAG TPA: serine protease [Clostridium sp.]|jgi:uncharacterized YkwD family protein|uniref:CAP domain-containing protein n=1 Tax=Clostridium lapidicellarium TaxID=3240931 RepID=A0ABV4DY00_9CLOT|nr:CAP domain-containing protein [uncultured Clostridium sp.]NLU06909.1 serine protease [Clostridiales bacterium]HBC97832.1 serine protease [Clostridium sp.]